MADKNILIAFVLNISFSIFELVGGIFTNSISIISDAVHDFGDALSIGFSFVLEKISKKKPNEKYTYGYIRYSVLGAFITTIVLTLGSILVIVGGICRILNPETINYNGMIIFAIFGVVINFLAAYYTKDGDSLNKKAVNLHMLEDVLGWVVVLIGSILMKFTDISLIDSIMSIGIAIFILLNTFKNLKNILDLFLEKTPSNISIEKIKFHISKIKGIKGIHHIHIWSMDGVNNYSTMHVITDIKNTNEIKKLIKKEMAELGISHTTIEIENSNDHCEEINCKVEAKVSHDHNNAHHHHY